MSLHDDDAHWTENRCDLCDRRIHPNAGALCVACALDFKLPSDPFFNGEPEHVDDVLDAKPKETTLNRGRRLARERRAG